MVINPKIEIEDWAGEPLKESKVVTKCLKCGCDFTVNKVGQITMETDKSVTLRTLIVNALSETYPKEDIDGMEKQKRGKLADKIYSAKGKVELISDDITLIKKLIGKRYGVLHVTRAYELIDPITDDEEERPKVKKKRKK